MPATRLSGRPKEAEPLYERRLGDARDHCVGFRGDHGNPELAAEPLQTRG